MKLAVCALVLAACSAPVDRKLPSAEVAMTATATAASASARLVKSHAAASAVACGDEVAFDGDTSADLRYAYSYDALGRLAHATGAYTAGGSADEIDYTYDHTDHLMHSLETRGWGDSRYEVTATYDTLGDLVDYTTDDTAFEYHDHLDYAMSAFDAAGQPTVEVLTENAQPAVTYQLAYDASERLAFVAAAGQTTTYTYDDDARTTTIDTGNGAFHGVIEYDEENRELSEVWGGSDPTAIASEDLYDYDGDRLLGATYRSGTTAAPKQAMTDEVDTILYDCATP